MCRLPSLSHLYLTIDHGKKYQASLDHHNQGVTSAAVNSVEFVTFRDQTVSRQHFDMALKISFRFNRTQSLFLYNIVLANRYFVLDHATIRKQYNISKVINKKKKRWIVIFTCSSITFIIYWKSKFNYRSIQQTETWSYNYQIAACTLSMMTYENFAFKVTRLIRHGSDTNFYYVFYKSKATSHIIIRMFT